MPGNAHAGPRQLFSGSKAKFGPAGACRREWRQFFLKSPVGHATARHSVPVSHAPRRARRLRELPGPGTPDAGPAIDAGIRIYVAPLVVCMEALDRAMFDAICKKTKPAIVRYDVW